MGGVAGDAPTDARLVAAAARGDRGAFGAIYDRYANGVHDFCLALLGTRPHAARAAEATFLTAAEKLAGLRSDTEFKPWLYGVARRAALARKSWRDRTEGKPQEGSGEADPVQEAAAELSEDDRIILELYVRHGFDGTDLVRAAGFFPLLGEARAERLIARAAQRLEARLIEREGLPGSQDAAEGPMARLAAVPPTPAPADLRDVVMVKAELRGAGSDLVRRILTTSAGLALLLALAYGTIGRGSGGSEGDEGSAAPGGGGRPPTTAEPEPGSDGGDAGGTSELPPDQGAGPDASLRPGDLRVGPRSLRLDDGADGTIRLGNPGEGTVPWRAGPSHAWLTVTRSSGALDPGGSAEVGVRVIWDRLPEGSTIGAVHVGWPQGTAMVPVRAAIERPPVIGDLVARPEEARTRDCPDDRATVAGVVEDESGLASVTVEWSGGTEVMRRSGSAWAASIGPFEEPGTVEWTIVAVDNRGNSATAHGPPVEVAPCFR